MTPRVAVLLLAIIFPQLSSKTLAVAPGVEEGDLFVGSGPAGGGPTVGAIPRIYRVRGGVAQPFVLGPGDQNDAGYFSVPAQVLVDSEGRVVWTAPLGDNLDSSVHIGVFRAAGEGAPIERLGVFRVGPHAVPSGYPAPFPDVRVLNPRGAFGLHLARTRSVIIDDDVDDGKPRVVTQDAYILGLMESDGLGTFTAAKTVAYGATTGQWTDSLPDPIFEYSFNLSVDMASKGGALYSIDQNGLRRAKTPLEIKASGEIHAGGGTLNFSATLQLFSTVREVRGLAIDDSKIPNVPSGVSPDAPNPPRHDMPFETSFFVMAGFQNMLFDPDLGLVISSNTNSLGGPFVTNVSEALIDDVPFNDVENSFYHPFANFRVFQSLGVTRLFPPSEFFEPGTGEPYVVDPGGLVSDPNGGGLIGKQFNRLVRVNNDGVEPVVSLANSIGGLATYPTPAEAASGISIVIRIDSPVDVLLTAPDGKQIGVDPLTGLPVNDFGVHGFDGGPGEPRFYAIENPAPGDWDVEILGTGAGPFTITAYGIDLDQPVGSIARWMGTASIGSHGGATLRIQSDASVALVPEPTSVLSLAIAAVAISLGRHGRRYHPKTTFG